MGNRGCPGRRIADPNSLFDLLEFFSVVVFGLAGFFFFFPRFRQSQGQGSRPDELGRFGGRRTYFVHRVQNNVAQRTEPPQQGPQYGLFGGRRTRASHDLLEACRVRYLGGISGSNASYLHCLQHLVHSGRCGLDFDVVVGAVAVLYIRLADPSVGKDGGSETASGCRRGHPLVDFPYRQQGVFGKERLLLLLLLLLLFPGHFQFHHLLLFLLEIKIPEQVLFQGRGFDGKPLALEERPGQRWDGEPPPKQRAREDHVPPLGFEGPPGFFLFVVVVFVLGVLLSFRPFRDQHRRACSVDGFQQRSQPQVGLGGRQAQAGAQPVDLVDHQDGNQLVGVGLPDDLVRPRAHPLYGVHHQQAAVAALEGAADLRRKIRVSGRIEEVDDDGRCVFPVRALLLGGRSRGRVRRRVPVSETDGRGSHRDAPSLLFLRRIEVPEGSGEAFRDDPVRFDQVVGECCFSVIDVSTNRHQPRLVGREKYRRHLGTTLNLALPEIFLVL
mmetsp:Transcript_77394/g.157144  ORF Transcript_77394/g.157144 Transcript_77394/m.157144 type:complete len:498 (+) Transcript_77394:3253-4746(+)